MSSSASVRVSIPVSVAGDIETFKKSIAGVLDKLGCPACCSGHDILFELQRGFVFDDDIKVRGFSQPVALKSGAEIDRVVTADLSPKVAGDIDSVFGAIDKIADVLGCPACCSGHDLRLSLERHLLVDANLNVKEHAFTIG